MTKKTIILLASILVVALGWGISSMNFGGVVSDSPLYEVRKTDMLISITEGGTLEAMNELEIASEVKGNNRILYLIPEGTNVKKGDLLVELDNARLLEKLDSAKLNFASATSNYKQAQEDVEIRKSTNASDLKKAELDVTFAANDLKKYKEGEWPIEKSKAQGDITLAEAELTRAQDRLNWTKQLHKQGYATRSELEADQLAVKKSQLTLEQAKANLKVKITYDYPQRVKKLESELDRLKQEYKRAQHRAESELTQVMTKLKEKKSLLESHKASLEDIQDQLKKTKIYAPKDGLVVYHKSSNRWRSESVEEGSEVRDRQQIISLPDVSKFKVHVKIHESRMSQVKKGQMVYVSIDSIPDKRFKGYVQQIAVLPDPGSWRNPNLKVYSTDVVVQDTLPQGVKPGLSCKVEIIVDKMEDIISVPIHAVQTYQQQQYCYVEKSGDIEARAVETGPYNDVHVQIASGLKEGEQILLNPPTSEEAKSQGLDFNLVDPKSVKKENIKKQEASNAVALKKDQEAAKPAKAKEGEKSGAGDERQKRRAAMMEKWKKMTPEQRKQMMEKWKKNAGKASSE